jgi:L-asparaginase
MPVLSGQDLLETLGAEAGEVEVHDFCRLASPQLGPQHWVGLQPLARSLLDREDIAGVVVSHGTSTLEETACFLDLTLRSDKPVVVTGAQRNASARDFDGPRNLLMALKICRAPVACGHGVVVALNEHVNAAREIDGLRRLRCPFARARESVHGYRACPRRCSPPPGSPGAAPRRTRR